MLPSLTGTWEVLSQHCNDRKSRGQNHLRVERKLVFSLYHSVCGPWPAIALLLSLPMSGLPGDSTPALPPTTCSIRAPALSLPHMFGRGWVRAEGNKVLPKAKTPSETTYVGPQISRGTQTFVRRRCHPILLHSRPDSVVPARAAWCSRSHP